MPRAKGARSAPAASRALGYQDVERLSGRLAAALRDALGSDLSGFTFLAIPRGGLFVLGMLSYLLDLPRARVGPGSTGSSAVVLVDDCALSGARLARVIDESQAERLVVAHLLSPLPLRAAVEREGRVERCLAGGDFVVPEVAPERLERHDALWRERLSGRRYWLGPVEPVAFPWSEPEWVWWNGREGRLEDGWHRVSPWRCLRFRAELGLPGSPAEESRGPLDLAPDAWWKLDGERLFVAGADGRLAGFSDVALDVWRGVLAFGDRERTRRHLGALYQADPEELRRDVDELVAELLARGLLVDASGR